MRIALLDGASPAAADAEVPRLASGLAARGHVVTVLCGNGGAVHSIPGVELLRLRRPPPLPPERFYEDDLVLAPAAIWRLARDRFDLAHAFAPALGWAASKARRLGGPPFAYSHSGELTRTWLVDRHYRLEMMVATAAAAAACFVDDEAGGLAFRRYLLREPEVVEPGAAVDRYEAAYARCASA